MDTSKEEKDDTKKIVEREGGHKEVYQERKNESKKEGQESYNGRQHLIWT